MSVIEIKKENFESVVLSSEKPVLLDFWASWCAPCRMLSPTVDEIAEENDAYLVGKINVDDQGELAARFGIVSIPTLIVFKNGVEVSRSIGVKTKEEILALLEG